MAKIKIFKTQNVIQSDCTTYTPTYRTIDSFNLTCESDAPRDGTSLAHIKTKT